MSYVIGEKGKVIKSLIDKSNIQFDEEEFYLSIKSLEIAWDELPEPKEVYSESYHIVWGILLTAIKIKDIDKANEWVDKIFICNTKRLDTGERELWAGKVAYETGELEKAKKYLEIANNKSRGRCFGNKDGKYLRFLKKS